jgi:hypothetical protein
MLLKDLGRAEQSFRTYPDRKKTLGFCNEGGIPEHGDRFMSNPRSYLRCLGFESWPGDPVS